MAYGAYKIHTLYTPDMKDQLATRAYTATDLSVSGPLSHNVSLLLHAVYHTQRT